MNRFLETKNCDRCAKELKSRILSWFNLDVICNDCSKEETELKSKLRETKGQDFEGCGLNINEIKKMIKEN